MTVQKVVVTAKNEAELSMRVQDLIDRGWTLEKIAEPTSTEHKHFGYKESKTGFRKNYKTSDVQVKHRASLMRDYQPAN